MEQVTSLIQEPLTSTVYRSCDKRQPAEREADSFNANAGDLNVKDGIDCQLCKNKGWIARAKKVYEDSDMMSVFVSECQCMKQRRAKKQAEMSGLGNLLKYRVNDYITTEKWQEELKLLIVDYIQSGGNHWLALLGSSGAGKTHLCSAVANNFLKNNVEVQYAVWPTMTKELKEDEFSQGGTKEMLNDLKRVPVLYIDDLFKGAVNKQDITLMFELLNYRDNADKITIVSSERTMEELAEIDQAIAGRINMCCGKYLRQIVGSDKNYRFKS